MVRKCLAWYLILAMCVIAVAPRVEAAFSPSEAVNLSPAAKAADMEKIRLVLENRLVGQRLHDLGYSADEVAMRLSQLTDNQIHGIAQKLDDLKVGQDGGGVIIFLLIVIVAILVWLQVSGQRIRVTK